MSLTAGSIAFVGFNADGNDNLAFVAIDAIPAGTTINFRDDEWNGTAFADANEHNFTWTASTAVSAGTIVEISNINSGTMTVNTGSINNAVDLGVLNRGISASAETVYAYTGTHTSPTFLAAITNTGSFTVADGSITGTGLTLGVTAIALPSSADVAAYNGTLNFGTDRNLALTTINNPSNWVTQDASGDQSVDNIVPDAPFLTDPDSPLQGDTFTICFLPGTLIATPDGARAVEALAIGDLVRTQDGRAVAVKWIGRQTLVSAFRLPEGRRPVAIAAGALGENLPARELRLTSDHALLLDGVLVNAGALVNGTTIRRLTDAELGARCTVFHIETENHEVILAEGTPAETFIDTVTRARFDNFAEWQSRHGAETEDMAELDLPRAASARQVPHALRARIAAIAARRMAAAA